jgi:glycosyltransferase involved in cell wall biosynthesis
MRILIVGLIESVHTARFIQLLGGLGWDVHLFPATQHCRPHAELRDVVLHLPPGSPAAPVHPSVRIEALPPRPDGNLDPVLVFGWRRRAQLLAELICALRPDILHSHELRHAGYLTFDARALIRDGETLPPWLVTNWGSDIFWWGRHPTHLARIKAVMSSCDFYACECHRDLGLARAFGFRGPALPVVPIPGGFDLAEIAPLRAPGPTSARRTVALKGYKCTIGRADLAITALDRCGDVLEGYRLALYLAADSVAEDAQELCARRGIELEVVSSHNDERPHADILAMHGRARVSVGLNRSDGTSVSFLEALAMGAFPIQSSTACGKEWARPGVGALFVDPEEPDALVAALRRALSDDDLVDRAVELNDRTVAAHLDRSLIRARVVDAYERVALTAQVSA